MSAPEPTHNGCSLIIVQVIDMDGHYTVFEELLLQPKPTRTDP